jgi:hypothetical protein
MKFVIGAIVDGISIYIKSDDVWVPPRTLFTEDIDQAFQYKTEKLASERARCIKALSSEDMTWGTGFKTPNLEFRNVDILEISVITVNVKLIEVSKKAV